MNLIDRDKLMDALNVFSDREHADPRWMACLESVKEIITFMPVVDAVPVELIQKRIDALKEVADAEFELNGGYVGSAFSLMCSLEGLLREWVERKEE